MRWPKNTIRILLLGIVMLILGVILVYTLPPEQQLGNNSTTMSLVHHIVWLIVLLGSMLLHFRGNFGNAIKYIALWIGIASALFIGYSLKDILIEFGADLKAELIPHSGKKIGNKIEFRARKDGHFVVEARVDGSEIKFLIDTGATDVVLKPNDALRLGFDLKHLPFDKIYQTANGVVRAASVRLGLVKIGPIEITNVRASVNSVNMSNSLLGMSFLSRIGGYEVLGDRLILTR
jgi:aspartyl protease family protein